MNLTKIAYPAVFYPDQQYGYAVIVPDLPGCNSQGQTIEEAVEMGCDAACGWILGELEEGRDVPKPGDLHEIDPDEVLEGFPGGFCQYLVLDLADYASKYGNQGIQASVTLPHWLKSHADDAGLDLSEVLQEALMEKTGIGCQAEKSAD